MIQITRILSKHLSVEIIEKAEKVHNFLHFLNRGRYSIWIHVWQNEITAFSNGKPSFKTGTIRTEYSCAPDR